MSDEEVNRKIEELREKRKARELSDLSKILAMREGRRVIWRLLSLAGIADELFVGNDGTQTAFNLGRRSVGLAFWKQIPPETELTMKREYANDQLFRETELKEIQNNGN